MDEVLMNYGRKASDLAFDSEWKGFVNGEEVELDKLDVGACGNNLWV